MLCKWSALSKSHFLLWKRNVVEPNDVYLNISFKWPYCPFPLALSWFWSHKRSLLENFYPVMWIFLNFHYWWRYMGGSTELIWQAKKKRGGAERHTVFSVKWIRHRLADFCGCCCSFLPLIADVETMIYGPPYWIVHYCTTLSENVSYSVMSDSVTP